MECTSVIAKFPVNISSNILCETNPIGEAGTIATSLKNDRATGIRRQSNQDKYAIQTKGFRF